MITKETQKNITHMKDCLSDDADPTFPGLQQALKEQDELEKEAAFTKEEEEKMEEVGDDDDGEIVVEEKMEEVALNVDEKGFY